MWCACLLQMILAVGSFFESVGEVDLACPGIVYVLGAGTVEVHRTIGGVRSVAVLNIPHFLYDDQVVLRFCWGRWDATIDSMLFPVLYTKGDPLV